MDFKKSRYYHDRKKSFINMAIPKSNRENFLNTDENAKDFNVNEISPSTRKSDNHSKEGKPMLFLHERHRSYKTEQDEEETMSNRQLLFYSFVPLGLTIVLLSVFFSGEKPDHQAEVIVRLNSTLEDLKSKFPSQTIQFWETVTTYLKNVYINSNTNEPTPLIMVLPKDSMTKDTGLCFAGLFTKIINSLSGASTSKVIDVSDRMTLRSKDDFEITLNGKIKESIQNENLRMVVIDHTERLRSIASLVFHGICKSRFKPHQSVRLLFLLHSELDEDKINISALLRDYLTDLFLLSSKLEECDGQSDALIERVASNTIVVTAEENLDCNL